MPPKGKPKAYWECPEPGTTCPYCSEITDLYCRKCGDTTCSDCRTTNPDTWCICHKSHICSVDKDSRPICLRPEQEEVLHYYGGLSDEEVKAYADAITTWRAYTLKEIRHMKKPRYLTERRRSYTSKNSVLTEEEFWSHNDRLEETRKDKPNILPAEVYRLDKTWKPNDVIASVSAILGIQLTGPQKRKRESMSLRLRDDPKIVLGVFDFGSLKKAPVCPHDNNRLPHEYATPPKMIACSQRSERYRCF